MSRRLAQAVLAAGLVIAVTPSARAADGRPACQETPLRAGGYDTHAFARGFDGIELKDPGEGSQGAVIAEKILPSLSRAAPGFGDCLWRYALVDLTGDGLHDVILESSATSAGAGPDGLRAFIAYHLEPDGSWRRVLHVSAMIFATRREGTGVPEIAAVDATGYKVFVWNGQSMIWRRDDNTAKKAAP